MRAAIAAYLDKLQPSCRWVVHTLKFSRGNWLMVIFPLLRIGCSAAKNVAHETVMVPIQPQSDAPQPKRRGFRVTWLKLLGLTLLFATSGIWLALWNGGLLPSWMVNYDQQRYTQIRRAIATDKKHLLGKSFEEVSKQLELEDVPWDDGSVQNAGQYRIYHFRGFAFYVNVDLQLPLDSPIRNRQYTGEELQQFGVLQIAHQHPALQVDGLNDRQERMKRFWKGMEESFERVNAEIERQR